ncbi:hypothetical protein PMAYCL1PPCAC_17336 [Pristionchus mayeri]|uniref:G protein-coupled receptor n=1 Tax=Pristionchus mayeri TaxID=1317129 RepID=A0AAN5CMH5_9BILA|nr:hypothetical protein PMAYCL1PPCAC_17336 [Pristionchus mayeri]
MIVGAISLHSHPSLLFTPGYLLSLLLCFVALTIVRTSPVLQPAFDPLTPLQSFLHPTPSRYGYIIQTQIFSNIFGIFCLACGNGLSKGLHVELFYFEFAADSLFHLASLCYVIVAIHRFVVIGQRYSELSWTESVPGVLMLTAVVALLKTFLVKNSHYSDESYDNTSHGHKSIFAAIFYLMCPLSQICVILTLDLISFKHLRFYNAQISDRIATNKNVEWRLLTQSICSCVPNLIFVILLLLVPNLDEYGDVTRYLSTIGLQLFDVVVDSLVVIVYSKPYGYFRARVSDSLSVESDSREESHL